MTLLGEVVEAVLQIAVDGGAELIHRRYRTLGCLVAIGIVALIIWLA